MERKRIKCIDVIKNPKWRARAFFRYYAVKFDNEDYQICTEHNLLFYIYAVLVTPVLCLLGAFKGAWEVLCDCTDEIKRGGEYDCLPNAEKLFNESK